MAGDDPELVDGVPGLNGDDLGKFHGDRKGGLANGANDLELELFDFVLALVDDDQKLYDDDLGLNGDD